MKNIATIGLMAFLLSIKIAFAQDSRTNFWKDVPTNTQEWGGDIDINAANFRGVEINVADMAMALIDVQHRNTPGVGKVVSLNLPLPDGSSQAFEVFANTSMHPDLQAKYPAIKAYDARAKSGELVKLDITPKGFHAMILSPHYGTVFIDPIARGDTKNYMVYYKKDFITNKFTGCEFETILKEGQKAFRSNTETKMFGSCELRTYRLAVAATGEYTVFHGGTVALALAAQVTTMNRVNGVYENDMAITLELIANNDLVIFDNPGTDPYTNGDAGSMIGENQTEIDNSIGSSNYDIGHVFGTNSGGLAGLGVVCSNNQKARGVTGSSSPIGDSFDIDYVAHEMGHQFGANHTQNNSCNNVNGVSVETGSATTIMGYAGICAPNVQNNSDDYFHGISLEEIEDEIFSHSCPVLTALSNDPPTIIGTNADITVPAGTPFSLTAIATDPNADVLTYCWEQMDATQSTQPPVSTSTNGPNFRSLLPNVDPTRYFPNLSDLSLGLTSTWEVVPTIGRTMNFRVTVRDNAPGGSCSDHTDVTLTTSGNSGPFVVLYPSASGISWGGLSTQTITWDVANSDAAPVNCSNVDILLSTDGGLTYPTLLASNVPNDGSEGIIAPNISTSSARIMVMSSSGTFFDISDNNFEIVEVSDDFILNIPIAYAAVCPPNAAVFTIDIDTVGIFTDTVDLLATNIPAGATATFGNTSVLPGGSTTLTVSNTGSVAAGIYTITVEGTSSSGTKYANVEVNISSPIPGVVGLISPIDASLGNTLPATFVWTNSGTGDLYDIIISTDSLFTNLVDSGIGVDDTLFSSGALAGGTLYYWMVTAYNTCGTGSGSVIYSFETVNEISLPTNGTAATQIGCTGTLFDSGGANSDYGQDEDAEITIAPTGASTIDLDFVFFNIEAGSNNNCDYDFIEIYDGPTSASPLIDLYCNDNVPTTLSSTSGAITLVFHSDGGTEEAGFQLNWQCVLAVVPPTPEFAVDVDTTCVGTVNFEDQSTNGPAQWAWDFGDGGVSSDQNPTYNYTVNGLYTVALTTTNSFGSNTETKFDYILVNIPTAPSGIGATICANESASITASGTNDVHWYENASGGSMLFAGSPYVTNPLATSSTFYVETAVVSPSTYGAKLDNSGGGNNFNNDQYLIFDVYDEMEIVSVLVYAEGAGDRTIELRDDAGTVLQTITVNIPDGTQRIDLNFVVPPGTDYQLGVDANGMVDMYRNNAGVNFPYQLGGLGLLTESSPGLDYYYFFYDWEIKKADCTSERVPIEVIVNSLPNATVTFDALSGTAAAGLSYQWVDCDASFSSVVGETAVTYTPTQGGNYAVVVSDGTCSDTSACGLLIPVGIDEIRKSVVSIYPNPSSGLFEVTVDNEKLTELNLYDVSGRLLEARTTGSATQFTLDISAFSNGVYILNIKGVKSNYFYQLIKS